MQTPRSYERFSVDIPIIVTTVLDSLEGTIVDLSEGGAQVVGCTLAPRTQCQLDLDGHIVFGTVRWSEIDRMGIRFPYKLKDGPLYDMLKAVRDSKAVPLAFQPRISGLAAAAAQQGGFGRRSA